MFLSHSRERASRALVLSVFSLFTCLPVTAAEIDTISVETQAPTDNSLFMQPIDDSEKSWGATTDLADGLAEQPNTRLREYGQGNATPMINGLNLKRISVVEDGQESVDVATLGEDHSLVIQAEQAQTVRVLKGPNALLYGATPGGVIQLSDEQEGLASGELEGQISGHYGTNNELFGASGNVRSRQGDVQLSLSAAYQEADDYEAGEGETVEGSAFDRQFYQGEFSWFINPKHELSIYAIHREKNYGIPHGDHEDEEEDHDEDEDYDEEEHHDEHGEGVVIEMEQTVYGLKTESNWTNAWFDSSEFDLRFTDYEHIEDEGGEAVGRFGKEAWQFSALNRFSLDQWLGSLRFAAETAELKVCHDHDGCNGFNKATRDAASASGEGVLEAIEETGLPLRESHPLANNRTDNFTLGWLMERDANLGWDEPAILIWALHTEYRQIALDAENIEQEWLIPESVDANYYDDNESWATSASLGFDQALNEALQLSLAIGYLERLPGVESLYWNGIHEATQSYIIGDRRLAKEKALTFDAMLDYRKDNWMAGISAYFYDFDGFIYQSRLLDEEGHAITDPYDGFDVYQVEQTDAHIYGGAVQLGYALTDAWTFQTQAEVVRRLAAGGDDLPRTAPVRLRHELQYGSGGFDAYVGLEQVLRSVYVAESEEETPGYELVFAGVSYNIEPINTAVWVKANNLLDQYAQDHSSFIKEQSPLLGRQFQLGVTASF